MKIPGSQNTYVRLIICSLLMAVVFIGISGFLTFKTEVNRSDKQLNQIIDIVESSAASAMYYNNAEAGKKIVAGLLNYQGVEKITLYNEQGLHIESAAAAISEFSQSIIRPLYSPFDQHILVGHLDIMVNADVIHVQATKITLLDVITKTVFAGLVILVAAVFVHVFLFKKLIHISAVLQDVIDSGGEEIPSLLNNTQDELGFLIDNINKILEQLTMRLSTQQALRKQIESEEKKLRNIFESTSAGLFLLDNDGNILICTPTLKKILGYEDAQAVSLDGKNFAALFVKEPVQFEQMLHNAVEFEQLEARDFELKSLDNEPLWVHCLVSKIIDISGLVRFEGVIFDISRRVATEKAMHYEINHDPLTGLLRRNAAEQRLKRHLVSANCGGAIVLLLDLDGFKKANDTYGHHAGDIVLAQTSRRLESCIRHNDIACRLGGDEFLIVLWDCSAASAGFSVAEKIIAAVREPILVEEQTQVQVGVSIGIALFPVHGISVKSLLSSADEAMYEVKRQGKNGYGIKNKEGAISVIRPQIAAG